MIRATIRSAAMFAALLLLNADAVHAQGDTLRLSLQDAVQRALRAGDEARLAGAQVEAAEAEVTAARASALPQLRLSGNYSHVFESARAQAVGSIFNQPNTYNVNANLSQSIFQGGRVFAGMRAASRLRRASRLTLAETQANVSFDVQRAYLEALYADRVLGIQQANYELATAQLEQVQKFEASGRAARYDVLRARVQRANMEPAVIQARADRESALLELKRLANLPMEQPLALTTSLDGERVRAIAARYDASPAASVAPVPAAGAATPVAPEVEKRASVRAAELTAQARHDAISIARASLLPTVSFFVQTGYQAFPFGNTFPSGRGQITIVPCGPEVPAGRTCSEQNGGWFSDRSLGVQVSWALFDGLRTKGEIDLAQAQARIADIQLAQEREAVAVEIAQARTNLERARSAYTARSQNAEEAGEAYRLASLRFNRGLSTQLHVSDAQIALMTAQTTEARAAFDLYLAAADLARALGEPIPTPDDVSNTTRTQTMDSSNR